MHYCFFGTYIEFVLCQNSYSCDELSVTLWWCLDNVRIKRLPKPCINRSGAWMNNNGMIVGILARNGINFVIWSHRTYSRGVFWEKMSLSDISCHEQIIFIQMMWNLYSFESVFCDLSKKYHKNWGYSTSFFRYGWKYITKSFFSRHKVPQMAHELCFRNYFLAL